MHPRDGDWRAWLDDEVSPLVRQQLDLHLAECDACRQEVQSHRDTRATASALLAALDGPVPARSVESILVRAERRVSTRFVLIAVAIAAMVVTAASATIQGVIFHRLTAALREAHVWPSPPAALESPAASDTAAPNGISTLPSDSIEIDFRGPQQAEGGLTLRLGDGPELTIAATRAVVYAVGRDRITVSSSGAAEFHVVLPRRAPRVIVRVAGVVVFAKADAAITTIAGADSAGTYVFPPPRAGGGSK